MDAVIEVIRNGLCCLQGLGVFSSTFLDDPVATQSLLGIFPAPMDQSTLLEILISITQLYAFVTLTRDGWECVHSNIAKLQRINRLVQKYNAQPKELHDRIVAESMIYEGRQALRSIYIGASDGLIGVCYWWFFIDTLHVSEVDWFGGLSALVFSIVVLEIALLPLLYFMLMDGLEKIRRRRLCRATLAKIQSGKLEPSDVSLSTYVVLTKWIPDWSCGISLFSVGAKEEDEKIVQQETFQVKKALLRLFAESSKTGTHSKFSDTTASEARLRRSIETLPIKASLDFACLIFNVVAFYGYLMWPLCHYFEESSQPFLVRTLKFNGTDDQAIWYGSFAGDLMWTLEPSLMLASPFILAYLKPTNEKLKKD